MKHNVKQYLPFATTLARTAGDIITRYFKKQVAPTWKTDNTPITIADVKINNLVIKEVNKHFPTHAVLGEESSAPVDGADYVWVCDPIDGTTPFSHGVPVCAFSLALVYRGVPILGVIFDPFLKRLYHAIKGGGSYLNGKKIQVSKHKTLDRAVIDFAYWGKNHELLIPIIRDISVKGGKTVTFRSTVYAGMLVASGQFAATISPTKGAHDAAALKVVIEEAGGLVTDLCGHDQPYDRPINGVVASNRLIHKQLVNFVKTTKWPKV